MERTITVSQLAEAINKIAQEHGDKTIFSLAECVSVPLLEKDYTMENK